MKTTGLNSYTSWFIVFATALQNFLTLVSLNVFGLIFVETVDYYETSRGLAAYPMFLCLLVRNCVGPFVGLLAGKLGIYPIITFGCLLCAIGIGLCYVAQSIGVFIFYFGIIYGLGNGLSATLLPQLLKVHFDKNISKANGFSQMGQCFGALACPALVEYFLYEFRLPGASLLMSGIILQSVPIAMLYSIFKPKDNTKSKSNNTVEAVRLLEANDIELDRDDSNTFETIDSDKSKVYCTNNDNNLNGEEKERNKGDPRRYSKIPYIDATESEIPIDSNAIGVICDQENSDVKFLDQNTLIRDIPLTPQICCTSNLDKSKDSGSFKPITPNNLLVEYESHQRNPDPCETSTAQQFNLDNQSKYDANEVTKCAQNGSHNSLENFNSPKDNEGKKRSNYKLKIKQTCQPMDIFLDPSFLVILITQSNHMFLSTLFITTIIDFSREKHFHRNYEVYIIMTWSVAGLVGRLLLSFCHDTKIITTPKFLAICYLASAVGVVLMALATNVTAFITEIFLAFTFISGLYTIFPTTVFEFMEKSQYVLALASRFAFFGPLILTVSPLIGYFKDHVGSYCGMFYVVAALLVFNGALNLFLPYFSKRRTQKLSKTPEQ